jgi:hypothetical protein
MLPPERIRDEMAETEMHQDKDPWDLIAELKATIVAQERALAEANAALVIAQQSLVTAKFALEAAPLEVAAAVHAAFVVNAAVPVGVPLANAQPYQGQPLTGQVAQVWPSAPWEKPS